MSQNHSNDLFIGNSKRELSNPSNVKPVILHTNGHVKWSRPSTAITSKQFQQQNSNFKHLSPEIITKIYQGQSNVKDNKKEINNSTITSQVPVVIPHTKLTFSPYRPPKSHQKATDNTEIMIGKTQV